MPDPKEISALTTAESTSASDLFETSLPNAMTETGYISRKVTLGTIANFLLSTLQFSGLHTTVKTIIGAINEVLSSAGGTVLTETLTAGSTTLTLSDESITSNSTLEVFTDIFGVWLEDMVVSTGSVELTFEAQAVDMSVKVRVS